jgi:hypothetical protein
MPHLIDYPFDDDEFHVNQPVSPSSPYRRASAPTALPSSHAATSSTKKKVKSWWTTATSGDTDHCPDDEIPDIIDTSSSSRDYGVMGVAYEDECEGHHRQQPQQQQYRYSFGATPPAMAPPSRNESSSSINSMPGCLGYGARDRVDNSDYEDDDNCLKRQQVHPDPYYRHLPPPPIPSPSARSIRSKQQQHRRSHRRSAVERRRSQKHHQPFNDYDDDDLLYQQHQQQFPRSSSSSSSGGAGTGGAASSHSHPSRASSRGGVGRRSSSNSIASGGPHRHSYPGRRSTTSSAARTKSDKDKLLISSSSSSKRGWWCLSSPRTLFRMLSFAGILSVSLTVLANRNLLLVGDPNNHLTSPLNANSVINWNSRDSFSLHYGNEHVSSSVSSMSSSSSSSSIFLQYPAADAATAAAAAATAAVAVAATTAAKAVSAAAATTARSETSAAAASSGLLRGKEKRSSVSTSPRKGADSATAVARSTSTSTFASDQRGVRHLSKDADSSVPSGPHLALLMPQYRSEGKADQRGHLSGVVVPQGKLAERRFESQDRNLYTYHTPDPFAGSSSTNALLREADRRVATLHASWKQHEAAAAAAAAAQRGRGSSLTYPRRKLQLYPPDFTDPTQLYGILDSGDERVKMMERRPPLVQGECVPMQEWQTTFHPSCNQLHESIDLARVGAKPQQSGSELDLFGTKGYWRNAWKVNTFGPRQEKDTVVLKTLK